MTRQRENFLVLMNNLDQVDKLQQKVQGSAGSANKKYSETYAKSMEAKINDFKHAWEELYKTIISSDFLGKIVNDATYLVKWFETLNKSTSGVKLSFLALIPLTLRLARGFKLVTIALASGKQMKASTMFLTSLFGTMANGEVKVISLTGALGKLGKVMNGLFVTSKFGWIMLAIAGALGIAGVAVNKYMDKVAKLKKENEKLTESQKSVNDAIAKGDIKGINESIKPLEEKQRRLNQLYKEKKKLEKEHNKGIGIGTEIKLSNTDGEIKKITNQLKGLGYVVDETTGKIFNLETAKNVAKAHDMVNKIKKEKQERVKNIDAIVSEIDEYNKLSSAENLNAQEKERLQKLTQDLKGKVKGLKVSVDEHGNAVIINTDLLGKNKEALILERSQILKNKDASYDEAKSVINDQIAKTNSVLKNTYTRIQALKDEEAALNQKDAIRDTAVNAFGVQTPLASFINVISGKSVNALESAQQHKNIADEINMRQKSYDKKLNDLKAMKADLSALDALEKSKTKPKERDDDDYKALDDDTKAKNKNTEATDANREAVNKAKEAVKQYELALKSLELQMTRNNIELGRLYEHSDAYINKLKEKQGLIRQEIELNKQQIGMNGQLAGSLVGGMGGSLGQQVVANAQKYLNTPYKWGGSTPAENFDCSGLVQYVYKQVGVNLNRTTYDQVKQGSAVSKSQLQPGDAVFFGSPSAPHHVGIYMGNGKYIHAPKSNDVVKISDLNRRSDYATARRYVSGGSSGYRSGVSSYSGKYASYINEASRKYGVPASLIAGIIKAESSFNPNERSNAGAMGLMQLMPDTARELGVRNPYDPRQNIMGGTQEIAKYLKKYGNLDTALAAYNAGMGNVQKYGGVPPFKETQNYIPRVKKYMKEFGGSESSIHSVINEQMDLIGQGMDLEKKNMELEEELNKINIQILESKLGKFDDKVKSIDKSLSQFRIKMDMAGKDDVTYINWLKEIDKYNKKKLKTFQDERKFIENEIKSNIYDEKTIEMLRQKNSELGTTMMEVNKQLKEIGHELASSKWEAIQKILKDNIELISNELERLSLDEEKNIKDIMILKQQMVEQDMLNIERITELIKELNLQEYTSEDQWLLDKIEEYNKELNKANTELAKHKKELEDVKKKMKEITSMIEDKLKEILTKTADLAKDQLDRALKHFEETIDAEIKKLDDAEKRNSYNEQKTEQLKAIADLQEKIARLSTDDSEEGIARRLEYEKQLQEEMKKKTDLQMKHNVELKKEALNKQKEDKQKETEKKKRDIDTRMDNVYLNLDARKALMDGYIEWINGKRIDIQSALLQFEDLYGKGLTTLGDKIKKEIIDQLQSAQKLLKQFGDLTDNSKIKSENKTINVYGAGIDLANAQKILGAKGYNYIDTKMVDMNKINLGKGDLVLGSEKAHNGISRKDLGGATRLGGSNRYETEEIIQLYKDVQNGKITPINGVVYGSGIDLKNAMKWLSPLGYEFVDTSKINPNSIRFKQNDLIVGSTGAKNGVPFDKHGVTRLAGKNRYSTDDSIKKFALEKMAGYAKENYIPRVNATVYGKEVDIKNAKSYLGNRGYNFVVTNSVRDVELSRDDIIVGKVIDGKENIYNSGAKWLYGDNRRETERRISEYAQYSKKFQGFKEGGTVDFTGQTYVHGSETSAETVFNARDSRKLYNLVHNLMPMNPFGYGFNKNLQPAMTTNNSNSITINFEVDKMYANEGEAKSFSSTIINNLKNWGKR